MQRARCGVAAARLHRQLQHPPPFTLGFSLAAVLPLACLTSRPAALRDAPRLFTFKIIRNHCKNSLCNKNKSDFAASVIIFFQNYKNYKIRMAEGNGEISIEEVPGKDSDVGRTPDYSKLIEYGLDAKVAAKLDDIYKTGKLAHAELDERALDALKEFPSDGALSVLGQFLDSNLEHVSNKSAYLCGVMKTYRQKSRAGVQGAPALAAAVQVKGPDEEKIKQILQRTGYTLDVTTAVQVKGPDEEKIKQILQRTGYTLDVTTGQRKYGGPPPNWEGGTPGAGCEVFCGKIPKDMYEDELIPLFERCGEIWDLRLMMDPMTGANRGYAFVTFTTRDATQRAVQELNDYEIRKGKKIGVTVSFNNHRLFVGNIPKNRDRDDLFEEFTRHAPGLMEVIIYSSPDDKKKNRGFCFLEYESHKAASLAKRRLGTGRIKVWGCDIIVDWADPQEEPDEQTMSKVKVLYVRNLTQDITEEALKEQFERYGTVERVKKIKDYAFVHFEERDCAVKTLTEEALKEQFERYGTVERVKKIKDYAFVHFEERDCAVKEQFERYGTVERVKKIKDYAFVHFEERDCAVKFERYGTVERVKKIKDYAFVHFEERDCAVKTSQCDSRHHIVTQDITEEALKEQFERYGTVERVKKIKDYAFVHFEERDCAVKTSHCDSRHHIVTQDITEEALKEQFERYGTVERVKKIKDYAFVHFEERDCAVKTSHCDSRHHIVTQDITEEALKEQFERYGTVERVKKIKDYAFVHFEERDCAVKTSHCDSRHHIVTQDITEEALKEQFERYGTVERVKKIKDYAFVHFEERDCAVKVNITEEALKEQFERYGTVERVKKIKDYAFVHFEERDCAVKRRNTVYYIVTEDITEEALKEQFERYGIVERVKKIKDYAFVHFEERDCAVKEALKEQFERYGTVERVKKIKDYAFVHFEERDCAVKVNITEEALKEQFERYGTVERVKKIKDYAFVHFEERDCAVKIVTQDITEEALKEQFERYGTVERVKKIKDYAFVHFEERDCAVKVNITEEALEEQFERYGTVERVKKIKDYAFVHFEERDCAVKGNSKYSRANARSTWMLAANGEMGSRLPGARVHRVVERLGVPHEDITEEALKEQFERYGTVERVKKIKDYAFVHFEERDCAVKAMQELDGVELGGARLEVSLAKPPSDKKKKEEILRARERRMMQMIHGRGGCSPVHGSLRGRTPQPAPRPPQARGDYDYDYDYYGYGDYRGGYNEPFYRYDEFYFDYAGPPQPSAVRQPPNRAQPDDELGVGPNSLYYDLTGGIQVPHSHTICPKLPHL
ncbi:RNA recognition motif domain-containing protein [Phthorimaea operculella]|nr:RNA recognition motif domain-containing protein [Phthorimaea operculella]